jgi:hypothetical protein
VTNLNRVKIFTSILLVFALLLSGCQIFHPKKARDKKAAMAKKAKAKPPEEATDVDFQAFVGRLRKAAAAHDMHALASMMTDDFGYRLNPEGSGEGVFKYWDDQGLWPELQGILSEKFVKKGDFMVAPPQFANPALNYDGYRAGIRRVNGSWKFAYFVNG